MKTPVTIESLLLRVKKEVAQKQQVSEKKKLEAKVERQRRAEPQISMYAKEELWLPVAIYREYEVQICDCCKSEQTIFLRQKVELRHKIDRSARRWINERGEAMLDELPLNVEIQERLVPECFCCLSVGRTLQHLFKGPRNAQKVEVEVEANTSPAGSRPQSHQEGSAGAHVQA